MSRDLQGVFYQTISYTHIPQYMIHVPQLPDPCGDFVLQCTVFRRINKRQICHDDTHNMNLQQYNDPPLCLSSVLLAQFLYDTTREI